MIKCLLKFFPLKMLPEFFFRKKKFLYKKKFTGGLVIRSDVGQKYEKVLTINLLFARRAPANNLFQI